MLFTDRVIGIVIFFYTKICILPAYSRYQSQAGMQLNNVIMCRFGHFLFSFARCDMSFEQRRNHSQTTSKSRFLYFEKNIENVRVQF